MFDLSTFEITPEGEVIASGALWTKSEFVEMLRQWLETAGPGEYELVEPA